MAAWAVALLGLGVQMQIVVARRQPHRRQVVGTGDQSGALDQIRRQAELCRPVGDRRHRRQVRARRMSANMDARRITAQAGGILITIGDGFAALAHHGIEA